MMDRKQSQFTQTSALLSSDYVPAFGLSTNKKISKTDFFKQIKDESQTFIYPTIELLQASNLVADPDNPIYVMVEETGYEFYKITSLAAISGDIALENGATATNQHVGYSAEPQTVAELRMVSKVNKTASTAGYYTAGDGGNGEYWLDATDTSSADNGFTIIVASDGGRWKLQSDELGWYNAKQAGAKIDGATDDTIAIQNAVNIANINIPAGTLKITSTIVISASNRHIRGAGRGVTNCDQYTKNQGGFWFKSPNAYTVSDYATGGSISDISVRYVGGFAPDPTVGDGILLTQMNGHRIYNVSVSQFLWSVTYEGGQLNSLKSVNMSCNAGSYAGAGSGLLRTKQSPIGGGASYQRCFTVRCEDTFISTTKLRDSCAVINMADGLTLINGYWGFGKNCNLLVTPTIASDYVGGVSISDLYLDCVGTGNTLNGIEVRGGAFAATFECSMQVGTGTFIANGDGSGIISDAVLLTLQVTGARIANFPSGYAINVEGLYTETTVNISGTAITNIGQTGVVGACRFSGLKNLILSGVTFRDIREYAVVLAGTINAASITGCVNSSNVKDLVIGATFPYENGLKISGNSSRYTAAGSGRWCNTLETNAEVEFPTIPPFGVSTVSIPLLGVGLNDLIDGSPNGTTNAYSSGSGILLFSYGVTSVDTVTIRAVNLSAVDITPPALTFSLRANVKF